MIIPISNLTFSVAVPSSITFTVVDFPYVYKLIAKFTRYGSLCGVLEVVVQLFETITWNVSDKLKSKELAYRRTVMMQTKKLTYERT